MSEWNEGQGEVGYAMAKDERCRPDYEGMIKREKDVVIKLGHLNDALHEIVFGTKMSIGLNRSKLKDLMGTIHVELLEKQRTIESLMEQQESDQ